MSDSLYTREQAVYYRRMVDWPKRKAPYGITEDLVFRLRLTREGATAFILDNYFPEASGYEGHLRGGRKGSFTRKFNRCDRILGPAWRQIDSRGRKGLYRVGTNGGGYGDVSTVGTILASDMSHANTVAKTMFTHVAGTSRWSKEPAEIHVEFLGGSRDVGREELFSINNQHIKEFQDKISELHIEIEKVQGRVRLHEARIQALMAFDYEDLE
jgi:hypothetical protein